MSHKRGDLGLDRMTVLITPEGLEELRRKAEKGDIDATSAFRAFKFVADVTLAREFSEEIVR